LREEPPLPGGRSLTGDEGRDPVKETSDPTPEEEVALAKKALAEGKLKRALYHVAGALEADPGRQEWLGLLDRVLAASRDPLQLTPAEKDAEPADVAVHCYILAHAGKAAEAVERLLELIAARPAAVRYLAWAVAWLDAPEAAGTLDMRRVNAFLDAWLQRFPGLVLDSDEARRRLKPLLPFARKIDQTQATDELFLAAHAALLRKSGRLDEALAVAEQAYQNQPGYPTALALAQAHEAKGDIERGCALTQEALRFKPDDVAARLEMGDRLWGRGRLDDAERWYKEALQRDPQHPWARPSYFALRYEMNQDEGWRNKLIEYARANPANERARDLVCRVAPYIGALPAPGDATIKAARPLLEQFAHGPPDGPVPVTLNWLEAPSARLAVDLQARALGLNLTFEYAVEKLQTPDPRKPRCPVE
jgi:tetratricopeptide (TPR) repeat protein